MYIEVAGQALKGCEAQGLCPVQPSPCLLRLISLLWASVTISTEGSTAIPPSWSGRHLAATARQWRVSVVILIMQIARGVGKAMLFRFWELRTSKISSKILSNFARPRETFNKYKLITYHSNGDKMTSFYDFFYIDLLSSLVQKNLHSKKITLLLEIVEQKTGELCLWTQAVTLKCFTLGFLIKQNENAFAKKKSSAFAVLGLESRALYTHVVLIREIYILSILIYSTKY